MKERVHSSEESELFNPIFLDDKDCRERMPPQERDNKAFPCATCGKNSVKVDKLAKGPDFQFCCKTCSRRFMPGTPANIRMAVLANRYYGIKPSRNLAKLGHPGQTHLDYDSLEWLPVSAKLAANGKEILVDCVYYTGKRKQIKEYFPEEIFPKKNN